MTPRLHQVALLLRSLRDLEYSPPTWTGQLVARQSRPGEGPSKRSLCEHCNGEGHIRRRGLPFPCEPCSSRGWIVTDAYTERPIGSLETGVLTRLVAVRCDACAGHGAHGNGRRCDYCAGAGVTELPLQRLTAVRIRLSADSSSLGAGDPVIACMERRERSGSYEELGLALAALRLELPRAFRTVVRVYLEASVELDSLDERGQLRHQVGLTYLSRLMPEEIRVPSWAARNERRRREQLKRRGVAA